MSLANNIEDPKQISPVDGQEYFSLARIPLQVFKIMYIFGLCIVARSRYITAPQREFLL